MCPREHCANCGSLNLKQVAKRTFKQSGKANVGGFTFLVAFVTISFGATVFHDYGFYVAIAIPTVAIGIAVPSLYISQTNRIIDYFCKECTFSKFRPITNVNLSKEVGTDEEKRKLIEEHFDASTSNPIVKELSKGHKRLIVIGIVSVSVTVIIWLVNYILPRKP